MDTLVELYKGEPPLHAHSDKLHKYQETLRCKLELLPSIEPLQGLWTKGDFSACLEVLTKLETAHNEMSSSQAMQDCLKATKTYLEWQVQRQALAGQMASTEMTAPITSVESGVEKHRKMVLKFRGRPFAKQKYHQQLAAMSRGIMKLDQARVSDDLETAAS